MSTADTDRTQTVVTETIHADITESNGKLQAACGINPGFGTIPGHSFVYHRSFDDYKCGEGERKCSKCERALARLGRHGR